MLWHAFGVERRCSAFLEMTERRTRLAVGRREQFSKIARCLHDASVEHDCGIANCQRFPRIMAYQKNLEFSLLGKSCDFGEKSRLGRQIDSSKRLVEEQKPRIDGNGAGQSDTLLLPT